MMVVKSATKKRLLGMGLAEDLCHKLATDRKIGEVRKMNISQLELLTESQYSAIATKLRITFDEVMAKFFTGGTKPKSSLEYRTGNLKSCIINWWTDYVSGDAHDFDLVMSKFRQRFPKSWIEMVAQVNNHWYPEYYQDWVDQNSESYKNGVFYK